MKQIIATVDAPPALGPYAQGVKVDNTIYVSGQLPMTPDREMVVGSIMIQTERVLLNIQAILEEAEATLDDVVKITIYLRDMNDFEDMNKVFLMFYPNMKPVVVCRQRAAQLKFRVCRATPTSKWTRLRLFRVATKTWNCSKSSTRTSRRRESFRCFMSTKVA